MGRKGVGWKRCSVKNVGEGLWWEGNDWGCGGKSVVEELSRAWWKEKIGVTLLRNRDSSLFFFFF